MSELQKSFAKARLARLPPEPPPLFDDLDNERDAQATHLHQDGGHDDDSSSASSASSTGTVVPSPSKNLFARGYVSETEADVPFSVFPT